VRIFRFRFRMEVQGLRTQSEIEVNVPDNSAFLTYSDPQRARSTPGFPASADGASARAAGGWGGSAAAEGIEGLAGRLARFFVDVTPVRLPVHVQAGQGGEEPTVLEFGTPREVFFSCRLPIEFGETVRVHNSDHSFDVEATIVAAHYAGESVAYAARFNRDLHNWIVGR
jgi:hypothetical protein